MIAAQWRVQASLAAQQQDINWPAQNTSLGQINIDYDMLPLLFWW
jgi:hypothetical protein